MTIYDQKHICLIGPAVETNYMGGVATHIKTLKSLSCFKDSVVYDPGSVNSNCRRSFFSVVKSIITISRNVLKTGYHYVIINSSIYPSSFLKLLLILTTLTNKDCPTIDVFFHGGRFSFLNTLTSSIIRTLFRRALKNVRRFYFLSKEQMNGFLMFFPEYSASLYANYSTADDILPNNSDVLGSTCKLLFVGRIVREKGIFDIISAMKKLNASGGRVRLTVAGDGPDLPELERYSEKLTPKFLRILGFVTGLELETEYRNADVLIFPSYQEGFPYVAIEAMRAGMPIIATKTGALDELVQDGITGFKVPPRDVDALAIAIMRITNDRKLHEDMSKNCHEYFKANLSKSAAERYYAKLIEDAISYKSREQK